MSGQRALKIGTSQSALFARASEVASGINPGWQEGSIEPISTGGFQCWGIKGCVAAHKDPDFPKWSYVLCLHSSGLATFWTTGFRPVRLIPGSIVEFDCHRLHGLRQAKRNVFVWLGIDSDDQISITEADKFLEGAMRQLIETHERITA